VQTSTLANFVLLMLVLFPGRRRNGPATFHEFKLLFPLPES